MLYFTAFNKKRGESWHSRKELKNRKVSLRRGTNVKTFITAIMLFSIGQVVLANTTAWSSGTTITLDCATVGVNCNDGITTDEDEKLKDAAIKGTVGNPTGCANFVCCPERPRIGSRQVDIVKFDAAWKRKRQRTGGATGTVIVRMPTSGRANVCTGLPCVWVMR